MKFKRIGKQFFIIIAYLLFSVLQGKAQTSMVFYTTPDQYNSSNFNPAFLTSQENFTFSILPLAGMSVGYNNQLVIKDMVLNVVKGNQTTEDFKSVFNSMLDLGLFYQRMEVPLLNIGYHSRFGTFNFSVKEDMQLMTNLKGQFSEFLVDPNFRTVTLNEPQMFPAYAMHYREYSLGYANEIIKNKLSVGIRAKIYYGKFSMNSNIEGEVIRRNTDYLLTTRNQIQLSFPINIIRNDQEQLSSVSQANDFTVGKYILNSGNFGTGFDIGFTYKIAPDLVLSASVIDVGKIKWKNNLNTMTYKGEYQFSQLNIGSIGNGTLTKNENFSTQYESIPDLYKIDIDTSPYSTTMPVTVFGGLQYQLNSKLNIGIVDRFIQKKYLSYNSLTLTGVFDVKKNLKITTGYAILGNSYTNIPLALTYQWDGGEYFIGTDSFLSFLLPSASDFSGVTFGMCFFLFKNKSKYKEHEYLPFYKEKKTISVDRNGLIKRNASEK